jgi:hypothetical protein
MNVNRRDFLHRSFAIATIVGQVIQSSTARSAASGENAVPPQDG